MFLHGVLRWVSRWLSRLAVQRAQREAVGAPRRRYAAGRRSAWVLAIAAGVMAASYLYVLSGLLNVAPATSIVTRLDVLFSSDLALRVFNLTGATDSTQELREHRISLPHPLMNPIWGTAGGLVFHLLPGPAPGPARRFVAARLLVAIIAATGIAALVSLGHSLGIPLPLTVLLLAHYLAFTANALVALPDHMGISSGLLTLCFCVWARSEGRRRGAALAGLAVLCGGTTITNGIFPGGLWLSTRLERRMAATAGRKLRRRSVWVAMLLGLATLGSIASVKAVAHLRGEALIYRHMNPRILHDPIAGLRLIPAALVYPAVGPTPHTVVSGSSLALTYEPLDFRGYGPAQGLAAIAWATLLALAATCALRDRTVRKWALAAAAWIGFNIAFHSVWGDELFLFTPHWSWALMSIVVLGAARARRPRVSVLMGALMLVSLVGQVTTLCHIVQAVATL
jgi:hypothetical protein